MAECRCGEIGDCEADIKVLAEALDEFNSIQTDIDSMETSLSTMSGTYISAFTSEKTEELSTAILAIDDDLISARDTMKSQIEKAKEELENRLAELQAEDTQYHKELEEREKEANQLVS